MTKQQAVECPRALAEILLGYLQQPQVTVWPGSDALTVDEVLGSYLTIAAARQVPGPDELLELHPELAGELAVFFYDRLWKPK
jgi:hypothetical protein